MEFEWYPIKKLKNRGKGKQNGKKTWASLHAYPF
jgi:hypothetical protein